MASSWGKHLKISIWGESHSESIGVIVDGLPAGQKIDWEQVLAFMGRRRSSGAATDTARKEADIPEIQSGLLNGRTCGTPICALIRNNNTQSKDYSLFERIARPGHADYSGFLRYDGYNDIRGGGHFSGRLTAPLCFAGALAKQLLAEKGIFVCAHIQQVGPIKERHFSLDELNDELAAKLNDSFFPTLEEEKSQQMQEHIAAVRAEGDSVGGVIECAVLGVPGGYGDPLFDSVESQLASLLFSIPAVKGVEFGSGFELSSMRGSQANDVFVLRDGDIMTETNHNGGILGGITMGMPLVFRCAFKPTPSIAREQRTVDFINKEEVTLNIVGRHDPCIVRRALPVVEAAAALVLLDILLSSDKRWDLQ